MYILGCLLWKLAGCRWHNNTGGDTPRNVLRQFTGLTLLTDHADGERLSAAAPVVGVPHHGLRHHPQVLGRRQPRGGGAPQDQARLGLGAVQQEDPHFGRRDVAHVPVGRLGHLEDALDDEVPGTNNVCLNYSLVWCTYSKKIGRGPLHQ